MLRRFLLLATAVLIGAAVPAAAQEKPRYGGELVFVVPSSPPSYDAHREETFGTIHPIAPHYNTLLRTDPTDKTGAKVVPDLAESWTISKDGDRKSTRLNSSHITISYAVFCLKKKKRIISGSSES